MYKDYYGFFYKIKQTVYKWWCIVYKPVYKLTHNGNWPKEKEPFYKPESETESISQPTNTQQQILASQMADQIMHSQQSSVDSIISSAENVDDSLARANEIMERLMREAAEDEAKKQAEIEEAKRNADEQARLAAIMKANQVDISQYIEEGKAKQNLGGN